MANNVLEYLMGVKKDRPNRSNWFQSDPDVGTNDWGFIKVKLCKEVIAGSRVKYNFKSAYSTNPTLTPVLSRAKVSVTAIWIPTRLYVPALRDGVEVKAGKTDYSFPTINFDYGEIYEYRLDPTYERPYVPANSIFSELGMWSPYFQPETFGFNPGPFPHPKNAIPLLGYIDFFRSYVMNSQVESAPLRIQGYSRALVNTGTSSSPVWEYEDQEPIDRYVSRDDLDLFFRRVRERGNDYPMGDDVDTPGFDISPFYRSLIALRYIAPDKKVSRLEDGSGFVAFNDNHFGEFRQTYLPDYYTAFLSNENVEYERSSARVVADDGGVITMEQIYAAQRVQKYIRSTVFKNSDYADFIEAENGVTPPTTLTKPLFLGNMSTWLSFNDVVAQANTGDDATIESNQALASRASLGFGRMVTGAMRGNDDRDFVDFTALEPGYFMVLESIVPDVCYFQGYDPLYDKRSLESLYYPAFERDGYQDKQLKYLVEDPNTNFNYTPRHFRFSDYNIAYAQEVAWAEYMFSHGKLSGQMVDSNVYRNWVLTNDFTLPVVNVGPVDNDRTDAALSPSVLSYVTDVYVKPELHNKLFANIQGLDNIQTYYQHEYHVYQPISHRFQSY